MARPIETAVECRQELIAFSKTFEQAGWKFKIESAFPRWRDRTEQRLGAAVSLKASRELAKLNRKPRPVLNESWVDVVAMHLAFLEELIHDVQIHPEEYGASVIAHERRMISAAREAKREEEKSNPRRATPDAPEEITLAKINRQPPLGLIVIYLVSVLAAFALGWWVAHVPAPPQVVAPPPGVVADSAKAPSVAPR